MNADHGITSPPFPGGSAACLRSTERSGEEAEGRRAIRTELGRKPTNSFLDG